MLLLLVATNFGVGAQRCVAYSNVMGDRVSVYGPAVDLNVVTNFPYGEPTDHQLFSAETVRAVVRTLCPPSIMHLVCDCMKYSLFSQMLAVCMKQSRGACASVGIGASHFADTIFETV